MCSSRASDHQPDTSSPDDWKIPPHLEALRLTMLKIGRKFEMRTLLPVLDRRSDDDELRSPFDAHRTADEAIISRRAHTAMLIKHWEFGAQVCSSTPPTPISHGRQIDQVSHVCKIGRRGLLATSSNTRISVGLRKTARAAELRDASTNRAQRLLTRIERLASTMGARTQERGPAVDPALIQDANHGELKRAR